MTDNKKPKESTIRLMTRLSNEYQAVNLSQGFTDMPVIFEMLWGLITASTGGNQEDIEILDGITIQEVINKTGLTTEEFSKMSLKDVFKYLHGGKDVYNQYSYPFGLPELRNAVSDYTEKYRGFRPDPETEITITSGATEGFFASLMTVCNPGDEVIVLQPYHEMYPAQAAIAKVVPKFISLKQDEAGKWHFNIDEFISKISEKTKALILNTPHNPTGKVFSEEEMLKIASICKEKNILLFTDEIYEHILYNGLKHYTPASYPEFKDIVFVINSISKTANATGWRVGWVITPSEYTKTFRGIHDTVIMQAPTPLQKAAVKLLEMDRKFYESIYKKYEENCTLLVNKLREVGFKVAYPEGSYYLFADYSGVEKLNLMKAMDASIHLIKEVGVATVPGDNFYKEGNLGDSYLRFAFCRSTSSIVEAANRLNKLK